MKNKGFTLIELLGGILILTVIALITIPVISGVINKARLNSLKDSAYGLIDASELYYAQFGVSSNTRFDKSDNENTLKQLRYKGNIKEGTVIINTKGKTTICVTDGKNSAYKNYNESAVTLVSKKTCTVPSNTNIVYLDNEATITALDNQELTDKIAILAEKVNSLETENNSLKERINTLETNNETITNSLESKASISALNALNTNLSASISSINTSLQNEITKHSTVNNAINDQHATSFINRWSSLAANPNSGPTLIGWTDGSNRWAIYTKHSSGDYGAAIIFTYSQSDPIYCRLIPTTGWTCSYINLYK